MRLSRRRRAGHKQPELVADSAAVVVVPAFSFYQVYRLSQTNEQIKQYGESA